MLGQRAGCLRCFALETIEAALQVRRGVGGRRVSRLRVLVLQNLLVIHQQRRPNSAEPPSMRQLSTSVYRPMIAMSTMSCSQQATTSPYVLNG